MLTLLGSRSHARTAAVAVLATTVGLVATACGTDNHSGTAAGTAHSDMPMAGMPGMGDMTGGNGLAATASGFTFAPTAASFPAGQPTPFEFRITNQGAPVTTFETDQTKLMHFYLVRSDLTGFQHIHPTMASDGTWTAPLAALEPGAYRAYTSFITKDGTGSPVPLVLGELVNVPGTPTPQPLPPPATTTTVDGYTLSIASGQLMTGVTHDLTVEVAKDGQPLTDLQPYLDTYAHLTAFHEGDLAFAHLHPKGAVNGNRGGPVLTFEASLPESGNWRLFLQFQTAGVVHTAAITITVG
jgi:hypothetical protein